MSEVNELIEMLMMMGFEENKVNGAPELNHLLVFTMRFFFDRI